ncbi:MAG TPA: uracil-DNA glycosylase family protein [archaeon]|nr:uracil-DNA glycosylase family protein [archaeon]
MDNSEKLGELWKEVHAINKKHFPDNNLAPILGNGKTHKPKIMFVFINPTIRNQSSSKDWKGPSFPWLGTKHVWRIFHRAGFFDDGLIKEIENSSEWPVEFAEKVLKFLHNRKIYFTNIVKWTGSDAALPDAQKINLFFPILEKEIEIVQPEFVVAFGLIPFERLAKRKIKLADYYSEVSRKNKLSFFEMKIGSAKTKIIPCYFPVGRGNPKRAVEILKLASESIN